MHETETKTETECCSAASDECSEAAIGSIGGINTTKINIIVAKQFRKDFDPQLQSLKSFRDALGRSEAARHASICITSMEDCIMRLGMALKCLGAENPYPNSRDTSNTIVDPAADGLKM